MKHYLCNLENKCKNLFNFIKEKMRGEARWLLYGRGEAVEGNATTCIFTTRFSTEPLRAQIHAPVKTKLLTVSLTCPVLTSPVLL